MRFLGDGKPADIASGIFQKVLPGHSPSDVDVPIPLDLLKDKVVELLRKGGLPQQSIAMRLPKIRGDSKAPQIHNLVMVELQ